MIPVDCSTDVPVSAYYQQQEVIGLREADKSKFDALVRRKGCVVAGIDYYALTNVSHLNLQPLIRKYGRNLAAGSVAYLKICQKDSGYSFDMLGISDGAEDR
ncbi:MAG TPA: hypothetical protein VMW43_01445 [Bacteroidota bacterium]|nr:hypothetical protein [Bacteroidota bacterium]